MEASLIEESSSPFAASVTLAYKREDSKRSHLCIDFRELNKLVVLEPQSFPKIKDMIVKTGDYMWYSTFDINSAFWSMPIKQENRTRTTFVSQEDHWQWKCLPFGLKISSSIFQRILANINRKHNLTKLCINYIFDILVKNKNFCYKYIENVTQKLKPLHSLFRKDVYVRKYSERSRNIYASVQ